MNGPDPGAIEYKNGVDIGVISVVSPSSGCDLGANETITVKIVNFNNVDVNPPIYVQYAINGGTIYRDTITTVLLSRDTINHSFTNLYDMSALGSYSIESNTDLTNDFDVLNDSVVTTIYKTAVPFLTVGNDTTACDGDTIRLSATPGFSIYDWGFANTQEVDVLVTGNYTLEAIDTVGCIVKDTIIVTFFDTPVVDLGNDTTICSNTPHQLDAGAGANYSYNWNTTETSQVVTIDGEVVGLGSRLYAVEVTSIDGCKAMDEVTITILESPEASLPLRDTICDFDSLQLGVLAAGINYKYEWSTGDTTRFITVKGEDVPVGLNTIHVLTTIPNGCFERDTTLLLVEVCVGINELKSDQLSVSVFPNPSSGLVSMLFDKGWGKKTTIEITDVQGKLISP